MSRFCRPLDNGFFHISDKLAKELAQQKKLPEPGKELLIRWKKKHWWLARTGASMNKGKRKWVWSVRRTPWTLENGVAVLTQEGVKTEGEIA